MKKLNFFTGGHPLTGDQLAFMQSSFSETAKWLSYALFPGADKGILYGCNIVGTPTGVYVSEGAIFWQNELFKVAEQSISFLPALDLDADPLMNAKFIIEVAPRETVRYADNSQRAVYEDRFLKLVIGTGDGLVLRDLRFAADTSKPGTNAFWRPRTGSLADYFNLHTGLGHGSMLGWAICDGRNGTQDCRGLYPVGWNGDVDGYNDFNSTFGVNQVTLTANQSGLREHVHKTKHNPNTPNIGDGGQSGHERDTSFNMETDIPSKVDGVSGRNGAQDALEPHENRPPSRVRLWIEKL